MSEAELVKRINALNIDLLNTVASLGELVIAQNATIIEIARFVGNGMQERGETSAKAALSPALDAIKLHSQDYVKCLRASVENLEKAVGGESDA